MDAIFASFGSQDDVCIASADGSLPWFSNKEVKAADMAFFKKYTMGRDIFVGRNTWEKDLKCKPLKGRGVHYVLSSRPVDGDCVWVKDISEVPDDCICIGGKGLYEAVLPLCTNVYWDRIYIPGVSTDGALRIDSSIFSKVVSDAYCFSPIKSIAFGNGSWAVQYLINKGT